MEPVVVKHASSTQNFPLSPTSPATDFVKWKNLMAAQRNQRFDQNDPNLCCRVRKVLPMS